MELVEPDNRPVDPETTEADDATGALDPTDEHTGRRRRPILALAVGGIGVGIVAGLLARYIVRARH